MISVCLYLLEKSREREREREKNWGPVVLNTNKDLKSLRCLQPDQTPHLYKALKMFLLWMPYDGPWMTLLVGYLFSVFAASDNTLVSPPAPPQASPFSASEARTSKIISFFSCSTCLWRSLTSSLAMSVEANCSLLDSEVGQNRRSSQPLFTLQMFFC